MDLRRCYVELSRCYLRLSKLPNFALDRLSRYEATLFGANPAKSCLRSMPWIAANHKNEHGASVSMIPHLREL
jgi:hypothetical protein